MKLYLQNIADTWIRKSLELVQREINQNQPLLRGNFKFFDLNLVGTLTNSKLPHHLGFQPKDAIITSTIGAGVLTINFDLCDKINLDISTTGSCKVRLFVGTYSEEVIE